MLKAIQIAWYEARMSSRGWRFWLLLMLAAGISLFARRDYLAYAEYGYFLHPAYSFVHPSFGLMLSVIALGAVALSLDICGRLRRTHMDQIVFPLPISTMSLMWGRLLGVFIIMIPISAFGVFSLGFWQMLYGHSQVVWQPFVLAYALLVIPFLIPISALLITLRTFWKHDFAALLGAGAIGGSLAYVAFQYHFLIDVVDVWNRLASASPTLGARVNLWNYVEPAGAQLMGGILLLYLAPLYLRRQAIQQSIKLRGKRHGPLSVPNLARWITDLRVDKHLDWGYRLSLSAVILIFASGMLWAAYSLREERLTVEPYDPVRAAQREAKVKPPRIDLQTVRVEIVPNARYNNIEFTATYNFAALDDLDRLDFELHPRYRIRGARLDGNPAFYNQWDDVVTLELEDASRLGETHTLTLRYEGKPEELHPSYSALEQRWLPLPWKRIRTESMRWARTADDLFAGEIALKLLPGQNGAFAGELTAQREENGARIEEWQTFQPVASLQVYWGDYEILEPPEGSSRMRFYHLPGHDYQAWIYYQEVEEQELYVRERLGELPFPQLTVIEKPYVQESPVLDVWSSSRWSIYGVRPEQFERSMPGQLAVLENQLAYYHEGIWTMERMDADPREIPFYRLLSPVRNALNDQFYRRLVETYYRESLNPVGDLAFLLREHLSNYAGKLLERWDRRRRDLLNYDVGHTRERPLSVAKNSTLIDLHLNGGYPELEAARGEGVLRMIHHLLGDDGWWELQKRIFREYRFRPMTADQCLAMAEEIYGEDLSWFVDEWVYGSALPEYEITLAEAMIEENKETYTIEYNVLIRVKNHGDGRMAVPIYIETEMDYIFRDLWIGPGAEETLTLTVPHRPLIAAVDPEHWVLQAPFRDPEKNKRMRSEKRINVEGEDASALSRGSRRNRGSRGRRWRRW